MKHLSLLLLVLLMPASLLAQQSGNKASPGGGQPPVQQPYFCFERPTAYQLRADSVLQPLDKSQVPSGILYDRTAGTAWLDIFNRGHNDADTSNANHWLQAYYELRMATYNEPGTLPCRRLLADDADARRRRDTVLIGALRYRFHTLDTLAVRDNLLRWDNAINPPRLLDVPGRVRSPYVPQEAVVAAALADSLYSSSGAAAFRLARGYLFGNTAATLVSATVDFGDGLGGRALAPGQTAQVSYGTTGWKTLRYVLNYSDGNQYTTYSKLWVRVSAACASCKPTSNDNSPCYTDIVDSNIEHPAGDAVPGAGDGRKLAIIIAPRPLKPAIRALPT